MTSIILALQLAGATARADDTETAAQLHLDRGVAAFQAGEYPRAHREFAIAHELAPDRANPYRWLALTEVQLGDCAAARGHIDEFVARVRPDDERIAELERLRGSCRAAAAPPRAGKKPVTRRWWFWTALAGVGAAIAGAAALAFGGGDDPTRLPPVHCDDTGCTP